MRTHRCRPTKTLERQRVPTSDDAPDAANRRSSPKRRPPPESETSPARHGPFLSPEEGKRAPAIPPAVGTPPRKGERGDNRTSPRAHSTQPRAGRTRRGSGPKTRTRAGGTHATEGTGTNRRRVGPGAHRQTLPLPIPPRPSVEGAACRARGHVHGPSPTTNHRHDRPPQLRHRWQDDKLCPT